MRGLRSALWCPPPQRSAKVFPTQRSPVQGFCHSASLSVRVPLPAPEALSSPRVLGGEGAPCSSFYCCTQWCCWSVAQSHPTLCNPLDCSTPAFPVLHHLLELVQTQVHRVGDAIQPSHPLSSPGLLLPAIFLSIRVCSNESALRIRWPKYWSFGISPSNEYITLY